MRHSRTSSAERIPAPAPVERLIRHRLAVLDATVAVHALHLPTRREVAVNADEPMNTASVIKMPIMIRAYLDADAGRLDLDERREVTLDDYRRGSGLIQTFTTPGLRPIMRDLVRQMIVTSDNIGTDIALHRVEPARVNAMLAQLGYRHTRVNKTTGDLVRRVFLLADPKYGAFTDGELYALGLPEIPDDQLQQIPEGVALEPAEWLGQSTAREMSRLLLQLHEGEPASSASTDAMLDLLRGQFYDSRLPRFIKEHASVPHKTGEAPPHVLNDAGIILHEGGPTVLTVFVNRNRSTVLQVEEVVGRIAQDLVRAWGTRTE